MPLSRFGLGWKDEFYQRLGRFPGPAITLLGSAGLAAALEGAERDITWGMILRQ
jgi:hypothetical protein